MKTYLVGGAIRDQLLGLPVRERDWVVTGTTPEQMIALGYRPVGKDFPVFLHPATNEEYALARTERKTAPGYKGFCFNSNPQVTVEDDLKRRDLTVNAIAQDENGHLIDPYGGQHDIQHKILRHVSAAFVEDPVRLLRVARFAARFKELGFTIAPETLALMRDMVRNNEVSALVPERIWQEFNKALQTLHPEEFILALRNCDALAIIFPEIDKLFISTEQQKNNGELTLTLLQKISAHEKNSLLRFAIVVHAFDQKSTATDTLTARKITVSHPELDQFCRRYKVPRDYTDMAALVINFSRYYPNATTMNAENILCFLEKTDALRRPQRFQQFLTVCQVIYTIPSAYSLFVTALEIIRSLPIDDLLAQQLTGVALAQAMRNHRMEALQKSLNLTGHQTT